MTRLDHTFFFRLDDQRQCRACGGADNTLPTDCPGDRMPGSIERDVRGGRIDFVEGRWTSVTPMQQIIDGKAEGVPHPPAGSRWSHANGNQYTVMMMANVDTIKPIKFPVIVIYRNQHGNVHTRKLAYWYESMTTDLGPNRDDPHLVGMDTNAILMHFLAKDHIQTEQGPEHTCKYCGAPSYVDPSDQTRPPDYCHPEDHGSAEMAPASDQFAAARERLAQWQRGVYADAGYYPGSQAFANDVTTLLNGISA